MDHTALNNWWFSDELIDEIASSGGHVPPNTLYGIPTIMDEDTIVIEAPNDEAQATPEIVQPGQCTYTKATIGLRGTTKKGCCPPIVSGRSALCPCNRVHPNGLRRPFKSCCGKKDKND